MRNLRVIGIVVSVLIATGIQPAQADTASDRAATVAILQQKYVSVLDTQHATLLALKEKMKVDVTLLKRVNGVLADFDSNYAAIVKGLANPDQELQAIIDLCEEEVEEFGNSIYELQQMAKTIKTIQCTKGKVVKTLTAAKPTCPKGYLQKMK